MKVFNKFLFLFLFIIICSVQGQQIRPYTYAQLTAFFDAYPENDARAMVFVNLYIKKAKAEKNLSELIAGYDEAVYYEHSAERKIKYADSAVAVAIKANDPDEISMSYLKRGIVYYYNKRNYNKALQDYLRAFSYSKNTKDLYLYHKILYHLGMVKSYLGFYEEAAIHFKETLLYYEQELSCETDPNLRLNDQHGYLNSLYRLSTCYRNLKLYRQEDSLIDIGVKKVRNSDEFVQEFAYFQKAKGINSIRNGNLPLAEKYLKNAGRLLSKKEDFAAVATVYFYLGKLHMADGRQKKAVLYFHKVDSILNRFNFVTPEVVGNYKYLIQFAKDKGDDRLQLYYTNKLLRADSIITSDFSKLSAKLYREYQVNKLNESRDQLVKKHKYGNIFLILLIVCVALFFCYSLYRYRQREKLITTKYNDLLEKLKMPDEVKGDNLQENSNTVKGLYSEEAIAEIRKNLKVFEEKKQFLNKDLKLPDVARLINTHRSALSFVLNEHMNTTFTQYIKMLRIKYITKQLMENNIYLQYSMDTLAAECGMKNRIVFSNHFLEINGIRPTDFVKKRLQELEKR
ncbi:helix-turn-helix domain-containing protein [Chryseobacterium sp. ON_d1]|uniref:helix-turn-helix domain-containing protein n=1 Tax=Chryseobacterium sp. ON_d1 TaxID=2583211 RepID=UPI00115AA13E|nr:helix-turn-helix domain-containing protein [Chryseobacterium sp. ON_d1]